MGLFDSGGISSMATTSYMVYSSYVQVSSSEAHTRGLMGKPLERSG